jgi:beta-glucosidase
MIALRILKTVFCLSLGLVAGGASVFASSLPDYQNAALSADQRVDDLLKRLTLEEKISLCRGENQFFIPGVPRLSLSPIRMADGPMGIHGPFGTGTCMPAAVCLAASWNVPLAEQFGRTQADSCRSVGVHILLGPGVNLARNPQLGRTAEYMGEDPLLAGKMAAAVIRGVQSNGVMACVKHFAANEMEYPRTLSDSIVDERTLRELYLLPFEIAVQEARVASVMGAYNHLNGERTCQGDFLLKQVLRDEWAFDGLVMSDWGAGGAAAKDMVPSGLDLAMPSGPMGDPEIVRPLIERGDIDPDAVDLKVRHIYQKIFEFGFTDRSQTDASAELAGEKNAAIALQVAREGMVLLKNSGGLLPLDPKRRKTVAVIGPHARKDHRDEPYVTGPSGSSSINPAHPVEILDAMRAQAPEGIQILDAPDPMELLYATTAYWHAGEDGRLEPGLKATYYKNNELSGEPALVRIEPDVNAHSRWRYKGWLPELKGFINRMSVRCDGIVVPKQSAEYIFAKNSLPGCTVWLDGNVILDDWEDLDKTHRPVQSRSTVLNLKANQEYRLKIEYRVHPDFEHWAGLRFGWGLSDFSTSEAVAAARKADVAVVCVGYDYLTEGEGFERNWELPDRQADLIRAVSAVNSNTVVVLTGGGPCATDRWIDSVPGMLMAWYLGENGATAVAEILFGNVNPSGKLPVTFDARLEDNPSTPFFRADWSKKEPYPIEYTEGIFMGYRGTDRSGIDPLFPFGFGLSYTTFELSGLRLSEPEAGDETLRAVCTVKNTGHRPGAEVVQLYIGDPESSVPRPVRELKGFQRVELQPGESRRVVFALSERDFSFFDAETKQWVFEPGAFDVFVGSSSRDLPLSQRMVLPIRGK